MYCGHSLKVLKNDKKNINQSKKISEKQAKDTIDLKYEAKNLFENTTILKL